MERGAELSSCLRLGLLGNRSESPSYLPSWRKDNELDNELNLI